MLIIIGIPKLTSSIKLNLISNNVKDLQSYKKQLKIFKYLKNKSCSNGILFLQETHSTEENEIKWIDDFNGQIHYSHVKSNLCVVLIAYGRIMYTVRKKASDKHGETLIIEALIDETEFILINLYNANTRNDQLATFSELSNLLENFDLIKNKPIIFWG